MRSPAELLAPNPAGFEADPLGYAGLAWICLAIAQNIAGFNHVDPEKPPTSGHSARLNERAPTGELSGWIRSSWQGST